MHLLRHKERIFAESAVVTVEGYSCPMAPEVDLTVIVALNGEFSETFDRHNSGNMAVAYPNWARLDTPSFARIDNHVPIFRFTGGVLQSDGLEFMKFLDNNCSTLQPV
jgi:hypothetical protein